MKPRRRGGSVDDCPVSGRLVRLTADGDHAIVNEFGWPQKNQCRDPPAGVGIELLASLDQNARRIPDGALYYVKLFGEGEDGSVHRISYPDSPVAKLTADPPWGDEPLEVDLDANESSDPKAIR